MNRTLLGAMAAAMLLPILAMLWGAAGKDEQAPPNLNELHVANVRDFGARGDDKTDDTAAIDKAWAFVMDTKKPQANFNWALSTNTTLYFPPGVYRYSGKGLVAGDGMQSWHVKGDGMNDARVEITSDAYFITCGPVLSTVVEGITFVGGKGVFKSSHTGNMVGGKHIFRDCYFFNYTECAIGNNADDSPYLTVVDCIFHCRDGASAIGIAWGGYGDDSQITRCHFEQNAYHLKLGDRAMGSSFQVGPRNSFFCWGGTKTKADIWIVPNSASGDSNQGQGSVIAENKFGNENFDDTRPRVLIAAEDKASGIDRLSRTPDERNSSPDQYVTGWRIRDNLIGGGGEPKKGVVYSCIPNAKIVFDHNYYLGSGYPWLIQFAPGIKRIPAANAGAFVYPQESNLNFGPTPKICNLPGYAIPFDPHVGFAGNPDVPSAWQRDDDPGYAPVVSLTGAEMPAIGVAKVAPVEDAHGGRSAGLVEFAQDGDAVAVRLDRKLLKKGKAGFIEVELKKAAQKPVSNLQVWIVRGNPHDYDLVCSRLLDPQEGWQRLTIPFVISDVEGDLSLMIKPDRFYSLTKQSAVICGNVRMYYASCPQSGSREGVKVVGDADADIVFGRDPAIISVPEHLTADRTLSFSTPSATVQPLPGFRYKIARSGGGGAKLRIADVTTLDANE